MISELSSWVLPFTFIPGVGMLVLSTANRAYYVNQLVKEIITTESHIYTQDLEKLVARIRCFHRSLISFYVAISCLAVSALCGNLGVNLLSDSQNIVKYLPDYLTAMGLLAVIFGASQLVVESFVATRLITHCKRTKAIINAEKMKYGD